MQAIDRRGYPIKVSVIANETDTGGESAPLADPQAYAELVVRELELFFPVEAPVVIVTPNGFGVAGKHLRAGQLQPFAGGDGRSLLRGIAVPPLEADALARTAMLAVRQVARAGGRPLPEHVPAAKALAPPPGRPRRPRAATASTPGSGRSSSRSIPLLAWALYAFWAAYVAALSHRRGICRRRHPSLEIRQKMAYGRPIIGWRPELSPSTLHSREQRSWP